MNQDNLLEFSDVLIEPLFSRIRSRKDVDVSTDFLGTKLSIPVLNSNMDTVASPALCKALAEYGTIGTLHRFWSIEENVQAFLNSISPEGKGVCPIVSIGIGDKEFERAKALYKAGASRFMLDVAHAANVSAVEMYNRLISEFSFCYFIVGDFGNSKEIQEFLNRVDKKPDAVKCGIGIGSKCWTRTVTGVGNYALSCLLECAPITEEHDIKLILDGGIKEVGDCAKALIAGADLIITGSLFSGCIETPGEVITQNGIGYKEYRGSASLRSYEVQGKIAEWRAPEGESSLVPCKGSAHSILNNINGGLRSSLSYCDSFTIEEFKAKAKFNIIGNKQVNV